MRATSPAEKERPVSQPGDKSLSLKFLFPSLFYLTTYCTHTDFMLLYFFCVNFNSVSHHPLLYILL